MSIYWYKYRKINFNKSNEKNNNLNIPKPNRQDNENFSKIHKKFIAESVFYIIIIIGIFFALSRIGFNVSSLLVILGTKQFAAYDLLFILVPFLPF